MRIEAGQSYITNEGNATGVMRYWSGAGYFTADKMKGHRWNHHGEAILPGSFTLASSRKHDIRERVEHGS
ncbi:hypothetical protein EVC12_082 [Rhizobium phage RHph_I42]|nr:hypothetical protein EVC12_082 [Rhizobium phage RHph_I42]